MQKPSNSLTENKMSKLVFRIVFHLRNYSTSNYTQYNNENFVFKKGNHEETKKFTAKISQSIFSSGNSLSILQTFDFSFCFHLEHQ